MRCGPSSIGRAPDCDSGRYEFDSRGPPQIVLPKGETTCLETKD